MARTTSDAGTEQRAAERRARGAHGATEGTARSRPESEAEEERRAGIRGDIIAAAGRLIAQQGESFTTQELTKEAGVALQTFYRHFGGKDQLLLALLEEMIAGHCENLEAQTQQIDDPVERIRLYIGGTLGLFQPGDDLTAPRFVTSQHWRLLQVDPERMSAATQPFADLLERELVAAQLQGSLHPRDPASDAWMIAKLVIAAFHHYAFVEDDERLATIADDVCRFCLAAVGDGCDPATGS